MGSEMKDGGYAEDCIGFDVDQVLGERGHPSICNNTSSPAMPCKVFPVPTSPTWSSSSSSTSPARFIEHTVSKMDTLAGVAIKYGVEVTDIKRMNNLVTDRQMFALKTLQIPLPGRHPPSPCLSNGPNSSGPSNIERTPPRRRSDILETLHSLRVTPEKKVSPAMSSLLGYYGLKPSDSGMLYDGFEMAVYNKGTACYLEDGPSPKPAMNPPLSLHRKSRSLANGLMIEDCDLSKDVPAIAANEPGRDGWISKLARQRQKSDADFTRHTPEKLLKEENSTGGWFSAIAGKGLALRNKAASRINLASETDGAGTNTCSSGPGDSTGADSSSGVRKSCSTSSLQDQENGSSSSIFSASKWSLRQDLQALSTSAIARPILDGFSKPITGRKSKTALD
ncbi:hypothetical protein Dimus_010041 [Dionaea muscipula]